MSAMPVPAHANPADVVEASLAALARWFQAAPVPEHLCSVVDQLEAAYLKAAAQAEA